MAQSKSRLQVNKNWNPKRRYKVGSVVSYLGSDYQNISGKNSDPTTLVDWLTKQTSIDPTIIDGSTNAVAGGAVFDAFDNLYQPNTLISSVPPTRVVNTFTYPALGYSALIAKTVRTNAAQLVTTVNAAATADHKRVDLIYFKSDDTIAKIIGTESLTVAPRPDVPANAVGISFINVFGNVVSDPTPVTNEISIQDSLGVEKFKITNYLRFKGFSFDETTKSLITDPLIPLSAFLNPVTGNDITASLENSNKPFQTLQALLMALPATGGETYTIYIAGGNVSVTRRIQPRNLRFISYNNTTIDFTNVKEDNGTTEAQFVFKAGTTGTFTFENSNISIISNYVGIKCFSRVDNDSNVILKGTINTLNWKSVSSFSYSGSFYLAAGSDLNVINLYDSAQDTVIFGIAGVLNLNIENWLVQYGRILNREPEIGLNLTVGKITQIGGTSPITVALSFGAGNKIPKLNIGSINLNGTFKPFAVDVTFSGAVSNNCNIDFQGTTIVRGEITGTNYHTSSFQTIPILFKDFTGKLGGILAYLDVSYTFQNTTIETNTFLIQNAGAYSSNIVKYIGFNSLKQIDTSQNLFNTNADPSGINPINITIEGTLKTNATTYGSNTTYTQTSSTFKEKLNEVVIRSKKDLINKVLSSTTTYIVDGIITLLTGEYIQVPAGGLTIVGYGFDVSRIEKNVSGESIFSSPAGNSGNFVSNNMQYNSGVGSVFNITDSDGSHAIEVNDVNFQSCSSLGTLTGYRQFTGTTCGIYGCSDGITLQGTWNGFKLVNTNAFGFGVAGTLIKKGTTTSFNNRLYLDLNLSLPTGAKICDFQSSNFASNKLLQVVNCLVKVNGIIDPNTTSATFPNITPFDPKSYFTNNIGLKNTFLEPYGLKNTNLSTYANDSAAATGGILVGEVYVETSTGYFKTRLT